MIKVFGRLRSAPRFKPRLMTGAFALNTKTAFSLGVTRQMLPFTCRVPHRCRVLCDSVGAPTSPAANPTFLNFSLRTLSTGALFSKLRSCLTAGLAELS